MTNIKVKIASVFVFRSMLTSLYSSGCTLTRGSSHTVPGLHQLGYLLVQKGKWMNGGYGDTEKQYK